MKTSITPPFPAAAAAVRVPSTAKTKAPTDAKSGVSFSFFLSTILILTVRNNHRWLLFLSVAVDLISRCLRTGLFLIRLKVFRRISFRKFNYYCMLVIELGDCIVLQR